MRELTGGELVGVSGAGHHGHSSKKGSNHDYRYETEWC